MKERLRNKKMRVSPSIFCYSVFGNMRFGKGGLRVPPRGHVHGGGSGRTAPPMTRAITPTGQARLGRRQREAEACLISADG